jgi:NitT/TauT family transport system ATP-binding protein
MSLGLRNIHKSFNGRLVFSDFSLSIPENKIICILGPSGCGKTTLLNLLGGTILPDHGEVIGARDKTIAYVFQEPRLLPWKTVKKNLEFVLKDRFGKEAMDALVNHHLNLVGLHEFSHFLPSQLSGGMKQRASLARAFAYPSDIILMDEPFRALDVNLRLSLIEAFRNLWIEDKRTVVFVTHDLDEACSLGEEIVVLTESPVSVLKTISKDDLISDPDALQRLYFTRQAKE